ncbi:MAG: DASS family sodium-coupled anion symporter [Akkermansia sp.]|nr:DASS family sodium-coupled anion symporter [Akkermansia sp.]MBQ2869719.1 DASS family sodium-coupled anion symporter [Akkermansia sp.]
MSQVTKTLIKLLVVLLISGSMMFMPFEEWGLPVNPIQTRVIALFVFAALMWILEVIPIWTTSVLVITLALLGTSNTSLNFLKVDKFDKPAVEAIVADAYGPGADAAVVKATQASVVESLKKVTNLTPDAVRSTINTAILKPVVAGKADAAQATALKEAAGRLFDGEVSARIGKLDLVNQTQQKSIFATFADPIIILFLGGFFLADAATKFRLDINLARVLLKPFGTNPKYVLLGLMSVTALFSMFMSNTATAAMMLALLTPVLALFKPEDRGRAAFALCIPIGANVGGIGTPIGTPPNAIALKFMQENGWNVTFGDWMMFGVPFVVIMLLIGWFLLLKMFPIDQKSLDLAKEMKGKFMTTPKAWVVYITFIVTILLWVIPKQYHGLDANSVAIVPIAVFSVTGVITKKDLKSMSWDVLWLVAGGFALGVALGETKLANDLINSIPFAEWNSMALIVGASLICLFMATFMSHTATAALLMPIMASVAAGMVAGGSMDAPGAIGLLVTIAFASSLGMALPISTPPNAMAYATGHVEQKGMAISGTILCLIGLAFSIGLMALLGAVGFFG